MKNFNKYVFLYLVIIALIATVLRLALLMHYSTNNAIESFEYDIIAKNLVAGKGYTIEYLGTTYKSFAAPLLAFLIASIYQIFGINVIPVICFQIVLSLAMCFVIYFIVQRISSNLVSCMAFTLCAFHPAYTLYSVKKIHALSLDALLFSLVVLFVIRLKEKFSLYRSVCVGFIFGLSSLSRPTILAFFLPVLFWINLTVRETARKKLVNTAAIILVLTMLCSLIAIRNYLIHKKLIIFSSQDTEVFWRSNNPLATGTSYREDGVPVVSSNPELYKKIKSLTELEKRSFFKDEAIKFVRQYPWKFIHLYITKLKNFWWFSPTTGLLYPHIYLILYKVYYSIILIFAVVGIIHILLIEKSNIREYILLILLFMSSIWFFQSLFYMEGRHRWGVESFLLIFTAYGLVYLAKVSRNGLKISYQSKNNIC